MKKYILIIILILSFFIFSCEDYLDKKPDDMMTLELVFSNYIEAREWLSNSYSFLPDGGFAAMDGGELWSYITDEGDVSSGNSGEAPYAINLGNWSPTSYWYITWNNFYKAIRSIHIFMDNVKPIKDQLSQEEVDGMIFEARFLRAYYYFLLIQQYGPVPLLLDDIPPGAGEEEMLPQRTPFDEIVNWMDNELNELAQVLPMKISEDKWMGQPTKGIALAVRARLLLYAASPLFNGNDDYTGLSNPDGNALFNPNYDNEKWKRAVEANKALIDLSEANSLYSLHKEYDSGGSIDPLKSYQKLFLTENDEVIFYGRTVSGHTLEAHDRQRLPRHMKGWSRLCATQNLVDAYFMSNGLPIDDPASGYSETAFDEFVPNMYINREPRFYASITYSGMILPNSGKRVDFLADGRDGMNRNKTWTTTGYLVNKRVSPSTTVSPKFYPTRRPIYIRLGEIYLNYAEALNEYYGPDHVDIRKYVGMVRERAGLTIDSYFPSGLGKEEMRDRIRHERQVELALEGLRYFDINRWKTAEKILNQDFYGMNIAANTLTEYVQRTKFETRIFKKSFYLFPIPQGEIDRNKNLVQNYGW